ncbi:MAG: sterol desaturase family protein [Blastocatellia bacterium]|nr:MAG: sterol desaturase family protein [Blastocatellia bacterium]
MKANAIYGLIVGALIFIPLERLFALRKSQAIFRRGWFTDVLHFLFTRSLADVFTFVFVGSLILLFHWIVNADFQSAVASQNRGLQFLEAVTVANVGGYFGHRLSHEVPFLWRFHSIHHSISEMDWLAAARVHPLDQIVTKALTLVPLYVLGFSKATFGAYIGLATVHAVFIHANVRFKFGPLRWLIGSPEFHHWHHSADPEAYNKNYAGELPLLDLIFGTYYLPRNRMPAKYGVSEPVPLGYLGQMLHPFRS